LRDLPAGGVLTSTAALTLYGEDSFAMPLTLDLLANVDAANTFATISRIHNDNASISSNPIVLTHTADDTTETILARVEPNESETFYRRYRLDNFINTESAVVEALVKRRHIELVDDNDLLFITNLTALGWAMDSLQYMVENDHTVADGYHSRAVALLNNELQDGHSNDEVPTIKFHYPGGTVPRLQSFY
jgi:hypothetical protein